MFVFNKRMKASLIIAGLFLFNSSVNACEVYELKSHGIKLFCKDFNNQNLKKEYRNLNIKIQRQLGILNTKYVKIDLLPLEIFIMPQNYFSNIKANAFTNNGRIFFQSNKSNELDISDKTLLHELSHLAVYKLSSGNAPTWLDEGLAMFISGELIIKNLNNLDNCKLNNSTGNSLVYCNNETFYYLSMLKVKNLAKEYGINKITEFLNNLKNSKDFEITYKQFFGKEIQIASQ